MPHIAGWVSQCALRFSDSTTVILLLRRYTNPWTRVHRVDSLESRPDLSSRFATPLTLFAGQVPLLIPRWRDRDSHGPPGKRASRILAGSRPIKPVLALPVSDPRSARCAPAGFRGVQLQNHNRVRLCTTSSRLNVTSLKWLLSQRLSQIVALGLLAPLQTVQQMVIRRDRDSSTPEGSRRFRAWNISSGLPC